jgi:hypothetical protein
MQKKATPRPPQLTGLINIEVIKQSATMKEGPKESEYI